MPEIRLTNSPADLNEIRRLLYAGEIDSDQALSLLKALRENQASALSSSMDRRKAVKND